MKRYAHIHLSDFRTLECAAIEMAHTLLELAGEGDDKYCNGCGDTGGRGHKLDCALVSLLASAGFSGFTMERAPACMRVVR